MVSPLSSRLLNLKAEASSVSCPPFATLDRSSQREWQEFARVKRISGYSADKESVQSSGMTGVKKQKRAKIIGITSKRRRVDELHYQAANAHSTLAQGGDLYKRSLPGDSCARPHESINTDAAKLITVSRNNPYEEEISTENLSVSDLSIYSEIVQSSKQFYRISGVGPLFSNMKSLIPEQEKCTVSCNTTNSTKSLISSDTESDDATPFVIPARFEDYNQNQDTEDDYKEAEHSEKTILKDALALSVVCSSSLEEAFAIQNSARLITGPEQPYTILHANAAFSQLTGLSSNKLIGRPLNNIMNVPTTPSELFRCPASKSSVLVSLKNTESTTFPKKPSAPTYTLKTSKVYSGTRMTHLSIDMEKTSKVNIYDNFIAMAG